MKKVSCIRSAHKYIINNNGLSLVTNLTSQHTTILRRSKTSVQYLISLSCLILTINFYFSITLFYTPPPTPKTSCSLKKLGLVTVPGLVPQFVHLGTSTTTEYYIFFFWNLLFNFDSIFYTQHSFFLSFRWIHLWTLSLKYYRPSITIYY